MPCPDNRRRPRGAPIDDERMTEALASSRYRDGARATLRRHGGRWLNDELFVIARRA